MPPAGTFAQNLGDAGYLQCRPQAVSEGECTDIARAQLATTTLPASLRVLFFGNSHIRQVSSGDDNTSNSAICAKNTTHTTHLGYVVGNLRVAYPRRSMVSSRSLQQAFAYRGSYHFAYITRWLNRGELFWNIVRYGMWPCGLDRDTGIDDPVGNYAILYWRRWWHHIPGITTTVPKITTGGLFNFLIMLPWYTR